MVVSPAVAPPPGGIATLTEGLVSALRKDPRIAVRLVTVSAGHKAMPHDVIARGPLAFLMGMLRVWRQWRPDVIHAMTWRAAAPIIAIPRRLRPRVIVHCLGSELNRGGSLSMRVRDAVLRRADELVAISRATAEHVERVAARRPVFIPVGIDAATFQRASSSAHTVMSVGRLVPRKGHLDAIRAVAAARSKGVDVEMLIVGSGPMSGEIDRLISEVGAGWCHLESGADDAELRRLYAQARVFLLLGREVAGDFEGFGIAFLEAAASGVPIVTTDTGGVFDAVLPNGNAVIVDNHLQAADWIERIVQDGSLHDRMASAGRAFVQDFAWPRIAERLVALYQPGSAMGQGAERA